MANRAILDLSLGEVARNCGFLHIFFEILRDQHAVRAQLAGAKNIGVTKGEGEEALRVTFLLSGMPAYLYGKAQLDEVMP